MRLLWDDRAWEEYILWQKQDKKTLKKIFRLMCEDAINPFQCLFLYFK